MIAAAAFVVTRGGEEERSFHNSTTAPGMRVSAKDSVVSFSSDVGVVGIANLFGLTATAPITLLDVRPLRADDGVELLAVRAVVGGRGTSPGGYRRTPGSILGGCWRQWPVAGYGPSYPANGMVLQPGDGLDLVYYVRSHRTGRQTVRGYRVGYRTADGRVLTVTGDLPSLVMNLHAPGVQPGPRDPSPCRGTVESGFTTVEPGYPA